MTDRSQRPLEPERHTRGRLVAACAVMQVLAEATDRRAAMHGALGALSRELGWRIAELWLITGDPPRLTLEAYWQSPDLADDRFRRTAREIRFERGQGLPGAAWSRGRVAWASSVVDDRDFIRGEAARALGLRGGLAFPLVFRGEVFGVITGFRPRGQPPERELCELMDAVGAQVAGALRRFREEEASRSRLEQGERAVRDARDTSERAARRKDEFLAVLGHELRNPLAPIMTALELMERKGVPGGAAREVAIVRRQSRHLLRLVDDLLDLSRITRGKVSLSSRSHELFELVAAAVEEASPLIDEREQCLELSVPERGLDVRVDERRMVQVLVNLLTNAAKYTDRGGHIRIEGSSEADRVILRVIDDGCGMDDETRAHLFEMFTQGQRSIDRTGGGLGLGLTIARSLVELHGGRVRADSDGPGCGSVFTVELPARDRSRSAPQVASRRPPVVPDPHTRLLLVDDNEDAVEMLAAAFEELGYRVYTAPDGAAGLALARAVRPDVAVLDIGLPVMDGHELARRIRANPELSDMRLVALTGYGQESDRDRAMRAGFDEHLTKPVEVDVLALALGAAADS